MLDNAAHFIFDSRHIDDIRPRLYGFYVTEEGLFTRLPEADISTATGAWVLVRQTSESIEITQDAAGCFGLFLFRSGSYWALSNSFNQLLDYLNASHRLSFNREYADAYLSQQLCIAAYGETIIKDIVWLDRRAKALINPSTGELSLSYIPLPERRIPVDTAEGLGILDAWHSKWARIVRGAGLAWPGTVQIDVTGGFDSRMVLATFLSSGINFDHVVFNSNPLREADYQIATMLAERFGFTLNARDSDRPFPSIPAIGSFSERVLTDIFFEKTLWANIPPQLCYPTISFRGDGGELLRGFWKELNCTKYVDTKIRKGRGFQNKRRFHGGRALVQRSYRSIEAMLRLTGEDCPEDSLDGLQYYAETRNRSHFSREIARKCVSHEYVQAPLLDPLLLSLREPLQGDHPMLISALILTRYHDALATLPFEGGRSIPEKTLKLAEELNQRHARTESATSTASDVNGGTWELVKTSEEDALLEDSPIDSIPMEERMERAFTSPTIQRIAKRLYGNSVSGLIDPGRDKRHPNADKYALVAISKAYEDARLGNRACKDFSEFIEACCLEEASPQIARKLPEGIKRPLRAVRDRLAGR